MCLIFMSNSYYIQNVLIFGSIKNTEEFSVKNMNLSVKRQLKFERSQKLRKKRTYSYTFSDSNLFLEVKPERTCDTKLTCVDIVFVISSKVEVDSKDFKDVSNSE